MQVFTQKRNPITGSTEWDVQHEDYDYHREIARSAFADMLHDTERNQKYYRALKLAIDKQHSEGKKANVLDIGTGTGLLSIMAAQCGADSIVACEAFKPMAECCLKILEQNGVADKIIVIPKRSTDLTVGEDGDMKQRANILVTEVFDTELIGEGALSTFSHAHKHLLEQDCIVVPDSAVIYAQVVECSTLQKWNKLNDVVDDYSQVMLRTPQKMKDCAGSAAVHDIQLSQLPRTDFKEVSEPIPVFYYDWSGKTPIDMKRTVKQKFSITNTGHAQMVFMWWDLNMDTEGKIVLSCAPWWCHPDTNFSSERPQDTIPWRDHWMQAVYYLPIEIQVEKDAEVSLVSCQDEYSLWFYLEDENTKYKHHKRPICECGVHMTLSRTHVSYLNDTGRNSKLLRQLKNDVSSDTTLLSLNGSDLLVLAVAKSIKKVYVIENMSINIGILTDYIKENDLENVEIIPEATDAILNEVTNVFCNPNFSSAILPWENLKVAYLLYSYKEKLNANVSIIPDGCEFWGMPVEFQDLHKIRIPLNECEGIKMASFDSLVERSRTISDCELEAQPMWEYPCWSRGEPRRLLDVDLRALQPTAVADGVFSIVDNNDSSHTINGFAVWVVWRVGGANLSAGPLTPPTVGQRVTWDMHTRQAVKILQSSREVSGSAQWRYQIACDLRQGQFDIAIDWVQ
ncbi:protein arginine N-methyltransferase 7-like isoform X2 [Aricia agestis]|nr:protein arginine N-methyltransferase 7-like isoform X2 [Aricia agestis]